MDIVTKHNRSNLRNKIILVLIIVLFIICYIFINRSGNSNKTPEQTGVITSNNQTMEIKRFASLSQNSAIFGAFKELNNGFLNLYEINRYSSRSSSNILQALYNASKNNEYENITKNDCLYTYAIYKYHPFFSAYAKNLHFNNIYLIEPQNNIILYSTALNNQLLIIHPSNEFNEFIERVKSFHNTNNVFQSFLQDTKELIIGSPVHQNNQLIGIIVATVE